MKSRWMSTSTTFLTLFIACVLSVVQLHGQNREGELGQYNGQKDAVHLQRYLLPEGTRVDTVVVGLSGDVVDTAGYLEIYGHSEGRVAPLRTAEPLLSVLVSKTTLGYEKISIPISYEHPGGQLFIGFRQVASRVTLVTDMQPRTFSCFDAGVPWNDQVRIDADGSRKVLPFGFDVRLATTTKQLTSKLRYQRDTTIEGSDPRHTGSVVSNIVVADATNDNVADILCFGVVQQWNGVDWTGTIVDASAKALHGMVADLNGDGHGEVVLVSEIRGRQSVITYEYRSPIRESSAKSGGQDASFQNVGASPFPNDMPIAAHVVLDINNDGREEILLFTSGSCSLIRRGLKGLEITAVPMPKLEEQIVAATALPRGTSRLQEIVVRLSRGSTMVFTCGGALPSVTSVTNGNKRDSSIYRSVTFRAHSTDERAGSTPELLMATRSDDEHNNTTRTEPRSEETLSSLLETDLDMDGRPELLSLSTGECRFISAWFGGNGIWKDATFALGLQGIDDVRDGIVADVDGNSTPDLVITRRGHLEVYRGSGGYGMPPISFVRSDPENTLLPEEMEISGDNGATVWMRHRIHGAGMQLSNVAPLTSRGQTQEHEITVIWDRKSSKQERFVLSGDNAISQGKGQFVEIVSGGVSLKIQDGQVSVTGLQPGSHLELQLLRSDGSIIKTWPELRTSSAQYEYDINQELATCASGLYYISAVAGSDRGTLSFTHIR